MVHRFILILMLILNVGGICFAQPSRKDFEYGPRPALSVFDPSGLIAPEIIKEISDPLLKTYQSEGIDVFVVILNDLKGAPPEHVARSFAKAWCQATIQAIVLHVPGQSDSPWIVPAGRIIKVVPPAEIALAVAAVHDHAILQKDDAEKIRTAATETTAMLRHWVKDVIRRTEAERAARIESESQKNLRNKLIKAGLLIGACLLIPLGGIIFSIVRKMEARRPAYFPPHDNPRRLGAPYAGGNHAVTQIGRPPRSSQGG